MRIFPLLLLLAGLLAGCGPALTFTPPPQTGHYQNKEVDLCFKVPPNWEIRQKLAGQIVVCLSPIVEKGDRFRENLVVTTAPPQTQVKSVEERLTAELPGWKLEREGVSPQGYPYFVGKHSQLGENLTSLVVLAERKDPKPMEFVLTFTATDKDFPQWEPVFMEVLPTIHLNLNDCPKPGETPAQTPTPADSPTP